MNLKEAFRFQNKLQELMNQAQGILCSEQNIVKIKKTHLRKKVMPEAENEVVYELPAGDYAESITLLAAFLPWLLQQQEALFAAIRRAKNALPIDMDNEVSLNGRRQEIARLFSRMAVLRGSEKLIPGGGVGYRFNAEGNQVAYRCDLEQVTTINFDREKVQRMAAALHQQADRCSTEIDRCLVNSQVDYVPPFDVNDSFDRVLELFAQQS